MMTDDAVPLPRYLLVARMPEEARRTIIELVESDPLLGQRASGLLEHRLAVSLPKGADGKYSRAQRQKAMGLVRKILAWEQGLWQPPDVFPESPSREAEVEDLVRPRRQARGLTAADRRRIEQRAVDVATAELEDSGWTVVDVGATHSYDLHCTKGEGQVLYVEVKGTTGAGDSIYLTSNEVAVARSQFPRTALFVVHGIKLTRTANGEPEASDGVLRALRPWNPQPERLEAKVYTYDLSDP